MKMKWSIIVPAFLALAVSLQAAENLEDIKRSKEEFQQAERAAVKRQSTTDNVQKDLDRLAEQKALWEREVIYYKGKLNAATAQLSAASSREAAEEIDKWKREAAVLEGRIAAAQQELQKIEDQTRLAIQNMQKELKDSVESSLILPGESIEVMVMEDESFNGVYQVRRGGYIMMPRVGRVSVAGKDLAGSEKAIKDALEQNQVKNATVMVERPDGGLSGTGPVIYLAGEFRQPGPWRVPQNVAPTVVTTVLRSGGVSESADLTHVRVLRLVSGQPLVEEVNVQAILDGVGLQSDLSLNPGDIIMIPAYANVIYVTGNVLRPGTLKLLPDDELTAYSAILRAGGFARYANRGKVFVLRDRGNGAKQKIPVSIKELQSGKSPDVILEPKDIVVVPEKFFSF